MMAAINGNGILSEPIDNNEEISLATANDKAELIIRTWGFPLEELFKLALKFYKG